MFFVCQGRESLSIQSFYERLVQYMNGINYSTLMGNTGFLANQVAGKKDAKYKVTTSSKDKTKSGKLSNGQDTVEIDGKSRDIPKAGYSRPKAASKTETTYKALDSNGIQEGIELSDSAKKVLEELRKKYQNMEISVARWSTDDEQDYYARQTDKEYSVLIAPEALEDMAADADIRAKYESVLDNAGNNFETLKEELGDDYEKIKSFSVNIDKDGQVSYAVQLIKDFEERNSKISQKSDKKDANTILEEKRAKRKEEQKKAEKEKAKKEKTERVEGSSIEELIENIKKELHTDEANNSTGDEELSEASVVTKTIISEEDN